MPHPHRPPLDREPPAGPYGVVGFASLPYLPTGLAGTAGERLEAAMRAAAARIGERHGTSIGIIPTFPAFPT